VREVLGADVEGDIRDREAFLRTLRETKPRVVFHLAAQPLVLESYRDPLETFDVNVRGTAAVLDAVRLWGEPCVVIVVTSDKCYENVEQLWGYREIDPMGGHDPYSASKGAAELVVSSYRRSFFAADKLARHGVALASVRAGNVIGGGDWAADRLMVDAVNALSAGRPVAIRNPRAVRPWQHVLEPLSGYVRLARELLADARPELCSGFNFGPPVGDCLPVGVLMDEACKVWGGGRWEAAVDASAPSEARVLRLNTDKAQSLLGWSPRWSVTEAVRRTVTWYKRFHASAEAPSMRAACVEDIESHLSGGRG